MRLVPAIALVLSTLAVPAAAAPFFSKNPAKVSPAPKVETVVEGLRHPWGIAFVSPDEWLVTERPGTLRLVRGGKLVDAPVAGVPKAAAIGQGGLMDISLHPRFAENGFVYLTLSTGTGNANRTELFRAVYRDGALSNATSIFQVKEAKEGGQHFGARLAWLPDGTLLMTIGDGGNPPAKLNGENIRNQAQSTATRFGKVVRLKDDGSIPADNPFVGRDGADGAVYSIGHRNAQGIAYDAATGRIWINEHGARGGDEINVVVPGKNYGWPAVTYSREYWGPAISDISERPDVEPPRLVWTPSIAPAGLAIYQGTAFDGWKGNLLTAGLISQDVRRAIVSKDGTITAEQSIPIGARVRHVVEGPDGLLYVLTDEGDGRILRLSPG